MPSNSKCVRKIREIEVVPKIPYRPIAIPAY